MAPSAESRVGAVRPVVEVDDIRPHIRRSKFKVEAERPLRERVDQATILAAPCGLDDIDVVLVLP